MDLFSNLIEVCQSILALDISHSISRQLLISKTGLDVMAEWELDNVKIVNEIFGEPDVA